MPAAPFDLEAVIESELPLGAVSSIPEYPYFAAGTCFLMRHRRRLWLVTAKHALKDKQDCALCVPWNLDTHDVLPLAHVAEPESVDPEDSAFADISVFAVGMTAGPPKHACIDLDAAAWIQRFDQVRDGDGIVFAGFPRESLDNEIDYSTAHIRRQRFIAHGRYLERDSSRWLHRVQVTDMGMVTTLQGMSGSPVFHRPQGAAAWSFAGVLVRGNDQGLAHFVEARVPWWVAHTTMRAERNGRRRLRQAADRRRSRTR